ncbi:MAG: hypothetical protein DWQ02_00310 [Bacteroidetes bacterium]|nr:MAG: hypothetical protein DWQ02_00310 [Bacteroidota bacterium]
MAYTIKRLNNSVNKLEPSEDAVIGFEIEGTAEELEKIYKCVVDINELADYEDALAWDGIKGSLGKANVKKDKGAIVFSGIRGNNVAFEIENIKLRESAKSSGKVAISVRLKKKGGPPDKRELATLNADIFIAAVTPKIEYFRIYPSIIRPQGKIELSWKCKNIDEYRIQYKDGTDVIPASQLNKIGDDNSVAGTINDVKSYENIKNNESFYLQAKLGEDMLATENNVRTVKIVETERWTEVSLKEYDPEKNTYLESTIVNLVLNERENDTEHKIWAFAKNEEVTSLWFSHDGLNWQSYRDNDGNKIVIPPAFVDSPALHFNGDLYLIGGSQVDGNKVSNKIARYNFRNNKWEGELTAGWEARMGHSCAVFPDSEGNDKIWVIGGADHAGNGLKDINCWDGINWQKQPIPQDFPERCLASISVKDEGKKELWLGGGIDNYEGDNVDDIWKYDGEWEQINTQSSGKLNPLTIGGDAWVRTSAVTALNDQMSLIAIIDEARNKYRWIEPQTRFKEIDPYKIGEADIGKLSGGWASGKDDENNYIIITRGFNGCVWLLAKQYLGKGKVDISQLYYSVPG